MEIKLFQIHSESMLMCLVLMILLLILEFNTRNRAVWKKYIFPMYLIVMTELIIDAVWFVIDGREQFIVLHKIIQTIYLCLYPVLGWIWLTYNAESFTKYRLLEKKWFRVVKIVTLAVNALLVLSSWQTGLVYVVNAAGTYIRGPLLVFTNGISYLTMITAAVLSVIEAFHARSVSEKKKLLVQASYVIPVLIMGLAQLLTPPGVTSAYFGFVIAFAMVLISSLNEQITQDALTGLLNQRTIDKKINDEIAHFERSDGLYLAVMDIDRFKRINDTYGHSAGDCAIKQVADIIRHAGSRYDADVSRIHGDEFVVFVKNCDYETADGLMQEIGRRVAEGNIGKENSMPLTISYGLAQFVDGMTEKVFFEVADHKLYEQKQAKVRPEEIR